MMPSVRPQPLRAAIRLDVAVLAAATAFAIAVLAAPAALARNGTLRDSTGAVQQPTGTVIYKAREFITMDPSKPRAEAVATSNALIAMPT